MQQPAAVFSVVANRYRIIANREMQITFHLQIPRLFIRA